MKATKEVDKYEFDLNRLSSIPSNGSLSMQLGSQSKLNLRLLSVHGLYTILKLMFRSMSSSPNNLRDTLLRLKVSKK